MLFLSAEQRRPLEYYNEMAKEKEVMKRAEQALPLKSEKQLNIQTHLPNRHGQTIYATTKRNTK